MKIRTQSIAAAFAITIGLSFVATPQVEAQGFLRYFGVKKGSSKPGHGHGHGYGHGRHGHQTAVSHNLRKNVAGLDRRSAEMVAQNARVSNRYEKARSRVLYTPIANFDAKVDRLVLATRSGSPKSIKSAAMDAKYAFDSVRSTAMRSHTRPEVRESIKQAGYILTSIQSEVARFSPVVVTRTPIASNHYNRRHFTPVPTVSSSYNRSGRSSTSSTTTAAPVVNNNNNRNTTSTTTSTVNNSRNTDRNNTATNTRTGDREARTGDREARTGDRDNTNNRSNEGERNQQGGGRGSR